MDDDAVDEDDGPGAAVPAALPWTPPLPVLLTLEVDGERFDLRGAGSGGGSGGGTTYDWVSGPNEQYGFGSSAPPDTPEEEHRASIRAFLDMIDPATGYIAED